MTWLVRLKKYLQQSWQSLDQDWQVLREDPIPVQELNQTFLQASLPALNFYLLLALAAVFFADEGVVGFFFAVSLERVVTIAATIK